MADRINPRPWKSQSWQETVCRIQMHYDLSACDALAMSKGGQNISRAVRTYKERKRAQQESNLRPTA